MADSQWNPESVRAKLKRDVAEGLGSAAQVFFRPDVANDKLGEIARQAVAEAASRVGRAGDVKIGKVRPLAKSAAVSGDPDVIAEMFHVPTVKSVLPSILDDVCPKPLNVREVE